MDRMRRGSMTDFAAARMWPSPSRLVSIGAVLTLLAVSGCSTVGKVSDTVLGRGGPQPGQPGYIAGFLGGVVADEPRAVLAGREVLPMPRPLWA
jgi:gamma-glutamyltranspeptidase/glutathione hydrolase